MKPALLSRNDIDAYLASGAWTRDTMVARYRDHASDFPDVIACQDDSERYTWAELDAVTDRMAGNLIARGLERDSRALVQMPSSAREMVLRGAFKKAGIIGAFIPMQWRAKELEYVRARIDPALEIGPADIDIRDRLIEDTPTTAALDAVNGRQFAFDEISLITVSSGTSGLAKLCEWPEAAQINVGRGIAERLGVGADDNIGMFAPMSGAAGVLVWTISATRPCTFVFPGGYDPNDLLALVERAHVSVATTVPVILARLAAAPKATYDLGSLRVLRVGTAAADMNAARAFEDATGCKVVVASGSMECPGFGHAHVDEPKDVRLDGSVGLPLPGCRLRVEAESGELMVRAPFAASGYWNDPSATAAAWRDGWYATGDIGSLDGDGRLTLLGRLKETINLSGHKVLPAEVEHEITKHPDVFQCAVVGAPDAEYGQVPWAFVQMRAGADFDADDLAAFLRGRDMAGYKMPTRIIEVDEFPRVGGNKIDKKRLLDLA